MKPQAFLQNDNWHALSFAEVLNIQSAGSATEYYQAILCVLLKTFTSLFTELGVCFFLLCSKIVIVLWEQN